MNRIATRWMMFTSAAVLAASVVASPAHAQDPDDSRRGVARISVMDGEVSVRRGDSGDWVAGVINAPLMTDDRISTAPNSRAEVEFDSANILRMGGNAEVRLAALEFNHYQMDLAHGTVTFRVLRPSTANIEVDTPNISIRPSKIGIYRISVNDQGETNLIVRAGDVEVFSPHGSQWVNAGQMMIARGNVSDPEFQIVAADPADDWDRWCDSRDRMLTQSVSAQKVPPGVYGTEDMDANGNWVNYPDYGPVWQPTVPVGWAPYQCGRWVWVDWYGWTWMGCESWGWAPYHYGRWFWGANYGWLWYPGVIGVRHYWSPALVGFFGFGGGVGVGFGFGNIGWVPLAPYEVFHPWWGRGFYGSPAYFNRSINVSNVNIAGLYRNARVANGVSAVAAADFRNGRFNNVMRPNGDQIRSAGLIRGQMPMAPTSASMHYSARQVSYVPRTSENTRFFQHQQPAAVQHLAFTPGSAGARAASASPAGRVSTPGSAGGGWRRFGEPAAPSAGGSGTAPRNAGANAWRGSSNPNLQNTRPPQSGGSNGWQRFGEPGGARSYAAPRNNAPSYSAPGGRSQTPQSSAPRNSGPSGGVRGGRPAGGGGSHKGGGR